MAEVKPVTVACPLDGCAVKVQCPVEFAAINRGEPAKFAGFHLHVDVAPLHAHAQDHLKAADDV